MLQTVLHCVVMFPASRGLELERQDAGRHEETSQKGFCGKMPLSAEGRRKPHLPNIQNTEQKGAKHVTAKHRMERLVEAGERWDRTHTRGCIGPAH